MISRGGDQGLTTPPTQGIYEISATQQYPLGTKLWYGDRCYKYGKATATMNTGLLCANNAYGISGYAAIPTATPAGGTTMYATVGSAEGAAADGAIAKDELVGGYVTVFSATTNSYPTFLIVANNAVAASGGTVTLTLDQSVPYNLTTSCACEINPCPYRYLTTANTSGNRPFMGRSVGVATTTYPYHWIQTWGPCWIAPQAAVGSAGNNNAVVARHDGSLDEIDCDDSYNDKAQRVGFVMTRVAGGAETQGTPLVFLQISC